MFSFSFGQAFYNHINGVYDAGFPDTPTNPFNYTGDSDVTYSELRTRVKVLEFGQSVQIVFQGTASLQLESHPIHLHGQNFYIVGSGFGNYNASSDPASFNLRNPPSRNTVSVPSGGWAAVRFSTTNPGIMAYFLSRRHIPKNLYIIHGQVYISMQTFHKFRVLCFS